MNPAKEIRRAVLQGRRKELQKLLLSDELIELYRSINLGDISTSSQLAKALNVTPENAQGKLKRLFDAGYVQRKEQTNKRGCAEYFYFT